MKRRGLFVLLCVINAISAVGVLSVLYVWRVLGFEWSVWSLLLVGYGLVVTPFLMFRLVSAYRYKPVLDMGFRPKVSVIIPCYNEEEHIVNTINAVLQSDYPSDRLEVIVVDDKSTDESLDVVKRNFHMWFCRVKTLTVNMGKRHAMAAGIEEAVGDVIVCVDSDTIIATDALTHLVQPFTNPNVYCVCGNAAVTNKTSVIARFQKVWYDEAFRIRKGVESLFGSVFCCSGVLAAYRRDKIVEVLPDFLNEKFFGVSVTSGDDRRLTNLMLRLGGCSVFQSSATAYTVAPAGVRKFVKQQVRWGRGSLRGMLFAASFFHRRPAGSRLLFYLTTFAVFASPVALLFGVVGFMLLGNYLAVLGYFVGLALIAVLFALTDRLLVPNFTFRDFVYRVGFFVVMLGLMFVYVYGWITSTENTWGTR